MRESTGVSKSTDGVRRFVYRWEPAGPPRALMHIAHGLAEHAGRYRRLAERLTAEGFAVTADDHRGHGRTIARDQDRGFFATHEGWNRVVADLRDHVLALKDKHPGLPVVLMGHSMGSMMVQHYLADYGDTIDAAVLSATSGPPNALAQAGRYIARAERMRLGARGQSALIHKLAFGRFNDRFKPARTDSDWLSRDPVEVDKYIQDPLCGFEATTQLWIDMLDAVKELASPERLARFPKALPIYLLAGTADPVSDGTKTIELLRQRWQSAGISNVMHSYYKDGRHELLNDTCRDQVTDELLHWLLATFRLHDAYRADGIQQLHGTG